MTLPSCPDCTQPTDEPAGALCGCEAIHDPDGSMPDGLDWHDSGHWSPHSKPCVHCSKPTHLRDGAGRPSHKVCSERVIDQQWRQLRAVAS